MSEKYSDDNADNEMLDNNAALIKYFEKLRHKKPNVAKIMIFASINNQDYHELRIKKVIRTYPNIIERALEASKRERIKLGAMVKSGELTTETSFDLLNRYVTVLERRISQRLKSHSRLFYSLLFVRIWPFMTTRQESAWSETLVHRILELAVFKYAKEKISDVKIIGGQTFVEDIDANTVHRLIEIVDLCREFYYATTAIRRTAKGGILDIRTWQVKNDTITEKLITLLDDRSQNTNPLFSLYGLYIDNNEENFEWLTSVAIPNRSKVIWPLRSSLVKQSIATENDDKYAYIPNYLIEPYAFGAAVAAIKPFRKSIEEKLKFRLEELFVCMAMFLRITTITEIYEPDRFRTLQRTGYSTPKRSQLVEYMVGAINSLPERGIHLPSDVQSTAERVIDFLTLDDIASVDLILRKPLKPFSRLTDERIKVDFCSLGIALHGLSSLVPHLTELDNQYRSDEFEEIVHKKILNAVPSAKPWRMSSKIKYMCDAVIKERQIDSGVIIGDVLLVSECKARSVGQDFEMSTPTHLRNVWETSKEYILRVDSLAEIIATKEILQKPLLPKEIRYVLPVVVQLNAEFVPTLDAIYWLEQGVLPRILTVEEALAVAKRIEEGDLSFRGCMKRVPVT